MCTARMKKGDCEFLLPLTPKSGWVLKANQKKLRRADGRVLGLALMICLRFLGGLGEGGKAYRYISYGRKAVAGGHSV